MTQYRNLNNDLERMLKRWNREAKAFLEKVERLGYECEPGRSAQWANMIQVLEDLEHSLEWADDFQPHPTKSEKELSEMGFTERNWN